MEQKVKELRVQIDGLAQLTKGLEEPTCYVHQAGGRIIGNIGTTKIYNLWVDHSKEIDKATDSLFLAKAWLGKVLGALGTESPYSKDGTRKTVKDIEPTADTNEEVPKGDKVDETPWRDKNNIEKVDWLRQEISKVVDVTDPYREYENLLIWESFSSLSMAYLFNCNRHLSEARFWLRFELERIREDEDSK